MENIDWSKAPEGAEVYFPNQAGTAECFAMFRGSEAYYAYAGMAIWTRWCGESKDSLLARFRHSFKSWNGEGLPPVGTVCEMRRTDYVAVDWQRIEFLCAGSKKAFFRDRDGHEWSRPLGDLKFRPVRTPEQIIADREREERVKAAQEWLNCISQEYGANVADKCEDILMAAEESKQADPCKP